MNIPTLDTHNTELGKQELLSFFWKYSDDNMFIVELNKEDEFIIIDLNPAQIKNLNLSVEEVKNMSLSIRDIFGEKIAARVDTRYRHCLEVNEVYSYRENLEIDGILRSWKTLIIPSQPTKDNRSRIFGISRELTSLLTTQKELKKLNAQLEQTVLERTSALEKSNEALKQQAYYDQLTGIGNRHYFFEYAEAMMASKTEKLAQCASVLYMDLDWFKQVNDQYGHSIGDKLLIELATRLKRNMRDQDIMARFGGEEFVVLLPSTPLNDAKKIAERILSSVSESPFLIKKQAIPMTLSIGIASIESKPVSLDKLLMRGDKALYHAKRNGKNRIEQY